MTKCFRTTVDLQQCNRRPAQPERNSQKSLHSFVVHSAGHPVSFTVYGRQDWTGLYAGKDAPPAQQQLTRASGTGWSNQWTVQWPQIGPHWVPCDRLRRSWEGQPGQGAPERRDPSQPRRDVWGTLDRLASPISLTLSHLAPTRGLVRNGGAVPAFQVGMSEGVKV